ncbi:hypothetical protein GGR57DRAFT_501029 [Xylariaceae sp. FL1272]|nr:hypothetical protein GGR57DRAFT_501029 [Xylariaceae sp. FL1272]
MHSSRELWGATAAAKYYPRILIPQLTPSGDLLYPFVNGMTESELRMSIIDNARTALPIDWPSIELLFYTELVKAEDTLRAYRTYLHGMHRQPELLDEGVQRFFRSRLLENKRFSEFYGSGVRICGATISMDRLLNLTWTINGVVYPSLSSLFRKAATILDPRSTQMRSCPTICGLGDAHGGNVIISPEKLVDGSREVTYVDYEVAGFHPVMLDIAKPFYNDVLFETRYRSLIPHLSKRDLTCRIENESVTLQFTPQVDDISQAILEIKNRYLIQPLCESVRDLGGNLGYHVPLLSNALLLCATLTRNFKESESAFLMNMATGIILSTAMDWNEFRLGLRRLGFSVQEP